MAGHYALDVETRYGFIALKVADARQMQSWYQNVAGMAVLKQEADLVLLGVRANRQVLLSLQQIQGRKRVQPQAKLVRFSIMLPHQGELLALAKVLSKKQLAPLGWFETGYSTGFYLDDPAGIRVLFEHDHASGRASMPEAYNWRQRQKAPIAPPQTFGAAAPYYQLPAGTVIGGVGLQVKSIRDSAAFLADSAGLTLQQSAAGKAYLTIGTSSYHVGLTLDENPLALPPQADDYGLYYLNIVLPNATALHVLASNLANHSRGLYDYSYDDKRQFLRIAGPNHLTLWFSVA